MRDILLTVVGKRAVSPESVTGGKVDFIARSLTIFQLELSTGFDFATSIKVRKSQLSVWRLFLHRYNLERSILLK